MLQLDQVISQLSTYKELHLHLLLSLNFDL